MRWIGYTKSKLIGYYLMTPYKKAVSVKIEEFGVPCNHFSTQVVIDCVNQFDNKFLMTVTWV
jgi:hypothetical protein